MSIPANKTNVDDPWYSWDDAAQELQSGRYASIDLGCGKGGSIRYLESKFALGPGFGVDFNKKTLRLACEAGVPVTYADLTQITLPLKCVRFVSMMDFLEHLPHLDAAREVLRHAASASRDFLYIRHPSFEHMSYLRELGFRISWSYWPVHTNMMLLDHYHQLFSEFGWRNYTVIPRKKFTDSSQKCILPLSAPFNTKFYDPETLEKKIEMKFDRPLFEQFDIFVRLPSSRLNKKSWDEIVSGIVDKHSSVEDIQFGPPKLWSSPFRHFFPQ